MKLIEVTTSTDCRWVINSSHIVGMVEDKAMDGNLYTDITMLGDLELRVKYTINELWDEIIEARVL